MSLPRHNVRAYRAVVIGGHRHIIAYIALFYFNISAIAGELESLSVSVDEGDYVIRIAMVMDAPSDYVYRVITDYKHAYRINPSITDSVILPSPDEDTVRVYNRSAHCVWLFCFDIDWTGDIVELQEGYLRVNTIPEYSSFDSGIAVWRIRAQGERTWIFYHSHFKPDFFIPPFIGEYFIKKHMRNETLDTFKRIECHAKTLLEIDMENEADNLVNLINDGNDCTSAKG